MTRLLMCPPTAYTVRYEINPWMKLRNRVDPELANAQWQGLYRTLRALGARVDLIPQRPDCPDMVFTANAGVVRGRTFIPSHFRHPQRRPEEHAFTAYFRHRGFSIVDAAGDAFFEGEGDLLRHNDVFFGGFGFRSESRAHARVAAFCKRRWTGLRLARPHFYHLDTCLLPLNERTVVFYPDAFDAQGRRVLREVVKNPIPVSREDAHQFACNALPLGRYLVLNRVSSALKKRLAREKVEVVETPTSEFIKAGGSVKCLVLKI